MYQGSRDAFDYKVGRQLEQEYEDNPAMADMLYSAISRVRNAEDEIRRTADQITRYTADVIRAIDLHQGVHEPYIERLGVDLKMAIEQRSQAYGVLVALLGPDRVAELQAESRARQDARE